MAGSIIDLHVVDISSDCHHTTQRTMPPQYQQPREHPTKNTRSMMKGKSTIKHLLHNYLLDIHLHIDTVHSQPAANATVAQGPPTRRSRTRLGAPSNLLKCIT